MSGCNWLCLRQSLSPESLCASQLMLHHTENHGKGHALIQLFPQQTLRTLLFVAYSGAIGRQQLCSHAKQTNTIPLLKGLDLCYIATITHSYKFNYVKRLSLHSPVGERSRKAHLVSCSDSHRPESRYHLAGSSGEFSSLRQYKAQF